MHRLPTFQNHNEKDFTVSQLVRSPSTPRVAALKSLSSPSLKRRIPFICSRHIIDVTPTFKTSFDESRRAIELEQSLLTNMASGGGGGEDISRNNVYRAKHPWPPNFSDLSNAEKYRYERKYKRRVRLATARPAWWMRSTGMLQFASVTVLPAYIVFFHDFGDQEKDNPFKPAKEWMRKQLAGIWGPMPSREEIRRQDPK